MIFFAILVLLGWCDPLGLEDFSLLYLSALPVIPYEIILTSASRPHLLRPTLESLLRQVDQMPVAIQIHDDAAFPGKWGEIQEAVLGAVSEAFGVEKVPDLRLTHADPPRRLGLAINWLLANVTTDYVLYSQDDFVAVRPVPLRRALDVMDYNGLHHIRFNKRATMEFKETWNGRWYKLEKKFDHSEPFTEPYGAGYVTRHEEALTVSDHWYFQLGLWRVSEMRRAFAFWTANPERTRRLAVDEPENMINHYFDHVAYGESSPDAHIRAVLQKTFIWGPIGEDRFIRHIGGNREDWAGDHQRAGAADDIHTAWREIRSYPQPEVRRDDA